MDCSWNRNYRRAYKETIKEYILYVILAVLILMNFLSFFAVKNHNINKVNFNSNLAQVSNEVDETAKSTFNNNINSTITASINEKVNSTIPESVSITDNENNNLVHEKDIKILDPLLSSNLNQKSTKRTNPGLFLFCLLIILICITGIIIFKKKEIMNGVVNLYSLKASIRNELYGGYELLKN